MSTFATTRLSSKGQIVIPEEIRERMGLHTGDRWVVLAEEAAIKLKTPVSRDPDDDKFIAIALAANCACVSGDNDLLKYRQPHKGVRCLCMIPIRYRMGRHL